MTTIDKKKFRGAVKRFRDQNDLTQSELAQKLMTTPTTIARWELGISVPNSQRTIRDLQNLGIKW